MRRILSFSILVVICLVLVSTIKAQTIVPAGTLLQCTLNEPNFSSATAKVGDPVVCYLRTLQQFGHIVLPAGSYLEGHLADAKDPGHLWGKGYLRLEFDRIGLPNADIPLPSKVIGASGGYKTDKEGDIRGKGHATRDAVEWMMPPLWPIKMLALPARGPRPTFRGEEQLTLRLMDDLELPKAPGRAALDPGWHYFDDPSLKSRQENPPAIRRNSSFSTSAAAAPQGTSRTTLIALKSDEVFEVSRYHVDSGKFTYTLADGEKQSVNVSEVNWMKTSQLNMSKSPTNTLVTLAN
jgi:hypothetical protein